MKLSATIILSAALLVLGTRPAFCYRFISEEQILREVDREYARVLEDAENSGTLNMNRETVARVRDISDRLISSTGHFRSDAPGWNWQINVITSQKINAWCMPFGKIVIYTGIIESLNLTDGEVAAVIGHEISHALLDHTMKRLEVNAAAALGADILTDAKNLNDEQKQLLDKVIKYGLNLPHSRTQEAEADSTGKKLMALAGYDPVENVSVLKKLDAIFKDTDPEFKSTHPSYEHRIENLEKGTEDAAPLYHDALMEKGLRKAGRKLRELID